MFQLDIKYMSFAEMGLPKMMAPVGLNNVDDKYKSDSNFGKDQACCSFQKNGWRAKFNKIVWSYY
jgi:hypothetical protein